MIQPDLLKMKYLQIFLLHILFTTCVYPAIAQPAQQKALVIIIDGLRPDYVVADVMPNLSRLSKQGVLGTKHHAVFPTVTRVNSASIATGSYPRTHGLMGNSMFVPELKQNGSLSTGERDNLLKMEDVFDGELLTAKTLSEYLAEHGKKLFAASSGSSGSGFLMNHRLGAGGLVHYEYVLPESLKPIVESSIGPAPQSDARPAVDKVRWAIDAILKIGLDHLDADALMLWVTEPDGTAHANGVGAPETQEALSAVDRELGRLLKEIERRGLSNEVNMIFTADHGFSTQTGKTSVSKLLVDNGMKEGPASTDVVLAGGAIHVRDDLKSRVSEIVYLLQRTDWIGPVFTKDGSDGTLPFSSIFWDHDRSADILTAYDWQDSDNEYGFAGKVSGPGVAGHGSTSWRDINTFFLLAGPAFKTGIVSSVPSGNVDIAPTILSILNLPVPEYMDGRVIKEGLLGGPDPASVVVIKVQSEAEGESEHVKYRLSLTRSMVNDHHYVDETQVERLHK